MAFWLRERKLLAGFLRRKSVSDHREHNLTCLMVKSAVISLPFFYFPFSSCPDWRLKAVAYQLYVKTSGWLHWSLVVECELTHSWIWSIFEENNVSKRKKKSFCAYLHPSSNWTQVIFIILSFQWSPTSQPVLTSDPLYQLYGVSPQTAAAHWISSIFGLILCKH